MSRCFRMTLTHGSREQGHSASLTLMETVYTDTGDYICSFNDSLDLGAAESNTRLYVFVWDSIHLMTHSGFDFQQSVAYKSAEIPCRYRVTRCDSHTRDKSHLNHDNFIFVIAVCAENAKLLFSDQPTLMCPSVSPSRGRGQSTRRRIHSSNLIHR